MTDAPDWLTDPYVLGLAAENIKLRETLEGARARLAKRDQEIQALTEAIGKAWNDHCEAEAGNQYYRYKRVGSDEWIYP